MTERTPLYKCKNCAWLAVRVKLTRELVGADDGYRDNGFVSSTNYGGRGSAEDVYDSLPVCFANKRDFYKIVNTPLPDQDKRIRAISEPIPCDAFEEWNRGISPKELRQMKMLEEQRRWQRDESDRQRAWEAQESKKNRQFQISEANNAETRHQQSLTVAKTGERSNYRSQIISGLIGAVATLLAVLVASWVSKPSGAVIQPVPVSVTLSAPAQPTPPDIDH